ncbi:MAG: Rrf2 family transcriptional regulator [Selenomonadaceae bacterium]|nr:Rrf2 family transcriptional regulator [Selenomonadaceae bacterium]MBR1859068.1 Rrf2 family transcriptional regulator [Selenomonadaceae bacterium]
MKISAKGRYGLVAMTHLAQNFGNGTPTTIISISQKLGISKIYLEQVFALLKRSKLVTSIKGSQGGYQLRHKPSETTVYDILSVIELSLVEQTTSESLFPELDRAINTCVYEPLDKKIFEVLKAITLEDILNAVNKEMDSSSQMYFI